MTHPLDDRLARAQSALRAQSWLETWAVLEEVNPDYRQDARHLGSLREDFELLAATVMRHRGQLDAAVRLYHSLRGKLTLTDSRIADVFLGLGECAHLTGDFPQAIRWMNAAQRVPVREPVLALRVHTAAAHILTHVNITAGLERFEWIAEQFPANPGTAWANYLFWHGDALLVAGRYQDAVRRLIDAHVQALSTGATITTADAMRRLPLARVLAGQADYALRGIGDLQQAERLYDLAGDRGSSYLLTEAGEVHRAIGQWREAERSFTRGLWAARSIEDRNREAHNQLGLFELSRTMGSPKFDLLDEAAVSYDKVNSDWGRLHTLICRALGDPAARADHLRDARRLAEKSTQAPFQQELAYIGWVAAASAQEISSEPHLMNYP